MTRPARKLSFSDLSDGLQAAKAEKLVTENVGHDGLRLYCYSEMTVHEKRWSEITEIDPNPPVEMA